MRFLPMAPLPPRRPTGGPLAPRAAPCQMRGASTPAVPRERTGTAPTVLRTQPVSSHIGRCRSCQTTRPCPSPGWRAQRLNRSPGPHPPAAPRLVPPPQSQRPRLAPESPQQTPTPAPPLPSPGPPRSRMYAFISRPSRRPATTRPPLWTHAQTQPRGQGTNSPAPVPRGAHRKTTSPASTYRPLRRYYRRPRLTARSYRPKPQRLRLAPRTDLPAL